MNILLCLLCLTSALANAAKISVKPVVKSGLVMPVAVEADPLNPKRLYVVEQAGRILAVEKGAIAKEPFLDIRKQVDWGGEKGLLGLAFHPDYKKNNKFYINFTTMRSNLITVIAEVDGKTKALTELITFNQPYSNHNGGQLAFGPDHYLYIGVGDGGSAGDPQGNGQNLATLLGKILRIKVPGDGTYSVPFDNPFVAKPAAKKEIFAYGLRNPWRFSFDSKSGALYVADVGQDRFEEIHIVEKGKNYGWNTMEGSHCFEPERNCSTQGLEFPIHEYPHGKGNISITGGYVYHGRAVPALKGKYIFGDYNSGRIWSLEKGHTESEELLDSDLAISSFGQTPDGEILVVDHHGAIYTIAK